MLFETKYWFVVLVAILVAAMATVFLLYFKNRANRALTKGQIWFLSVLRFLSFFFIAFLLLSPFVQTLKKNIQNPVIITAWDNSGSIISTQDSVKVASEIATMKSAFSNELAKKYSIQRYTFGENTSLFNTLNFSEKKSDYSNLITTVANNHFNENVGALILIGDGIYNQGKNPVNLIDKINFPIYTIGLGDTSQVTDARIQEINVNRTSFSGNRFPVEVDVQFSKLKGKPLKLSIIQNNTELTSTVITPPNNNFFFSKQFILEAGKPGLKHYLIKIEEAKNERNIKNNRTEFVINILENKQKILILSNGSHPDVGAIKNTLDLQKTYEVSVFTEEPYPANLSDYNLIILNQLPTRSKSIAEIIKRAAANHLPLLFIVGNKTFLPQLNLLEQGAKITPLAGSGEEAQATLNPTFATFQLSDDFKEILPKFPPLQVAYANFDLAPGFTPLLYQKILNIETAKPLIATGHIKGRKIGFIFGEGIWRWRLYNYYVTQNQSDFNELINQLVQYLALRENEDNFIIDFKPVYAEIDDVVLKAEVYNDAFERVNSEEVNIEINNKNGDKYNFTFDVQGENYYLNAGHLPSGDYSFSANVKIGEKSYTETGSFSVVQVNFENIITRANHNLLYRLASESGGKFYRPNEVEQLIKELESNNRLKPVSYYQEMIQKLLNLRWVFFVILLLLSVEWFLRKYWGVY